MGRLLIHEKTSHACAFVLHTGNLPMYGQASQIWEVLRSWEVFPCQGRLHVYCIHILPTTTSIIIITNSISRNTTTTITTTTTNTTTSSATSGDLTRARLAVSLFHCQAPLHPRRSEPEQGAPGQRYTYIHAYIYIYV